VETAPRLRSPRGLRPTTVCFSELLTQYISFHVRRLAGMTVSRRCEALGRCGPDMSCPYDAVADERRDESAAAAMSACAANAAL